MMHVRVNGFQRPATIQQILAFALVLSSTAVACGLVFPFAPEGLEQSLITTIYFGIFGVGFACMLYTEMVDPVREQAQNVSTLDSNRLVCQYCDNEKEMKTTTKHCHLCNKCVSHFDHHCIYLNTCIGARNYWTFFGLVTAIVVLQIIHVVYQILLIVRVANDNDGVVSRVDRTAMSKMGYMVVSGISLLIPVVVLVAVGSLLGFHIYIKLIGTTTFLWIKAKRRMRLERQKQENEMKMKRHREQTAVEERNKIASERERHDDEKKNLAERFVTDVTKVSEGTAKPLQKV
mmetsp:Transcript_17881/g.25055  ORF Transcript_17881/g.25055 Transcript_17881/m.25055 type:complete len:290 (+) Transcript_17881:178-1047(+)